MASQRLEAFLISQQNLRTHSLSPRWRVLSRILLATFLVLSSDSAFAQQLTSTAQQTDKSDIAAAEEKAKDQKAQTRSAAMAMSGDSAAGSIGGIKAPQNIKVNSGGGATQSIPIIVPPGTAGVQPKLSLDYDSQGDNGLLGMGWSVSGLPVIHRCAQTVAQDGFRGAITYTSDDRFCLDGQRLMKISTGNYGANDSEYRTEIDSFLKITAKTGGSISNGPAYFIVKNKNGETMEFGGNASSDQGRIEPEGRSDVVRVWALSKSYDVKGNYFTVTYAENNSNGEFRPTQIDYTGNTSGGLTPNRKVTFEYATRTDQIPQWIAGSKVLTTQLLTNVKTYAPPPGSSTPVLFRDYRLEYETGTATSRSRINRIKECDAAGSCLSWQFAWQEGGNGTYQYTQGNNVSSQFSVTHVRPGDYNNDGKTDLLTVPGSPYQVWTYFSNGDGTFQGVQMTGVDSNKISNVYLWTGDVNGDGREDLVTYKNNAVHAYLSQGNGQYNVVSTTVSTSQFDQDKVWHGDFNGDGRLDLVTIKNLKFYTYLSNGDGTFTVQSPFNLSANEITQSYVRVGDFNGDGKADLVTTNNSYLWTYFSNGNGTFQKVSFNRSGMPLQPAFMNIGDVNGDGKSDIVSFNYSNELWIYLSKGNGAYEYKSFASPVSVMLGDDIPLFGDFNGDGKLDVVTYSDCGEDPNCPVYLITFFSKGDGSFSVVQQAVPPYWINAWVGDYSGDGKSEVMNPISNYIYMYNPVGPYPDLLTNITNPFQGTNAITYKPLTDPTVYAKDTGSACPPTENPCLSTMHAQYPLYVVSQLSVGDGLPSGVNFITNHTYAGMRINHFGRGNLGFRQNVTIDQRINNRTTTYLHQFFPLTGLTEVIEVDRNTDQAPFRETFHEYWNINAYPTQAPTLSFVAPKKIDIIEYEGSPGSSRTIRREFSYDDATTGNLISTYHHGNIGVAGDEREETTDWVVDSSIWLHRPKTQKLKDGGGNLFFEKWIYYDGLPHGQQPTFGLITKEEINTGDIGAPRAMGDPLNAVTTYVNDPNFGIRTSVTDPRGCSTAIEYDSTKTFQTKLTNCLTPAHVREFTFDPRHGGKLTDKDPNLQVTTTEYDGFGRVTKVFGPLDSSQNPTVSFQYVNLGTLNSTPSSQHVKTLRREQHGGGGTLDSWEYFNGLGQVNFTKQEGPDASTFIASSTVINGALPKVSKSAPYFVDANHGALETAKFSVITSDLLGRQSLIEHPNSSGTVIFEYFVPGKVKITDERGKVRWKYFDAYGQLIQIDEINQGATYTTTFKYDAAGNQIQVKNALNHYTSMAYDMAGRKRAMCDPNMGTSSSLQACSTTQAGAWVYTYNPAGDLLTQKDAKNQTLTMEVDLLGRPTFKKQGTTTLVQFTYDTTQISPPPSGGDFPVGRLTKVNQPQISTTALFAYDKMGRTLQTKRQLLGVWHTMSQQFDALSRITVETFPDNEQVTYNYNTAGLLQSVLADSGLNYINDIQYNARGQKTQVTYGNNLVTNWTFNPDRFFVTSRVTSNNQQNLTYTHDPAGNILTITDAISPTGSRTFTYDDLRRLSTAVGNFGSSQSFQNCTYVYTAVGNFDNKCGTTFTYGDAMHPSAVTYNPASNKSYSYDNNGNMLNRGSQTLVYDIDNRVTSVAISGGGTTTMEYDHSGSRIKKYGPAGMTLFPFGRYEIDPNNVVTKFIQIGVENFASRRGTSKLYYHTDHLGSIHVITNEYATQVQLNEYDPWGGVSKSVGNVDPTHRFTGKELDPETGLYYFGGRYYDPEISRFISPDPFIPKPGNPQSLNRYSYTINNPQNYIDPSGYHHLRYDRRGGYLGAFLGGFAAAIAAVVVAPLTSAYLSSAYPGMSTATNVGISAAVAGGVAGAIQAGATGQNPALGFIKGFVISGVMAYATASVFGGDNTLANTNNGEGTQGELSQTGQADAKARLKDVTDDSRIEHTKKWFENRTGESLSINQKVYLGGTTSNARIFGNDVGTLYLREDLLSFGVSPEIRYGTIFHEWDHYAKMSAIGVDKYFEKVEFFNNLGLTGPANPWERISEFRGAALASEYLGRPVRTNPFYNVENLR